MFFKSKNIKTKYRCLLEEVHELTREGVYENNKKRSEYIQKEIQEAIEHVRDVALGGKRECYHWRGDRTVLRVLKTFFDVEGFKTSIESFPHSRDSCLIISWKERT